MAKRVIVLIVAVIFTLGIVGLAFAGETITGKVTKIDGNKLTVQTSNKEVTVVIKVDKSTPGLKVGDTVVVRDGEAKKKKVIEGC